MLGRPHALSLSILGSVALLLACAPAAAPATAPPAPPPASGSSPPASAPAAAPAQPSPAAAVSQAPVRATLRFGGIGGVIDRPLYVAQDKGFFDEQGLDLEIEPFSTSADMVPWLATGRLDAGHGSTSPGFFNAILQGAGAQIVTDVTILREPVGGVRNSLQLAIRRELADQVRGVGDLKGRIIGINQRGTVNHGQLERLLTAVGLTLDDVEIETVPFPDQMAALGNGAVDAAVMLEPFLTLAGDRGIATPLVDFGQAFPGWPVQVLFYSPEFGKGKPDVGRRFLVAYMKALRYMEDATRKGTNRDEVIQLYVKNTPVKDAALWQRMAQSYSETNGRVNTQALEIDQEFYVRQGFQRAKVEVGTIVDPSFAQYAIQVLGRYAD